MGIFDFLKRKPKKKPENFGYQRVVDTGVKPSLSTGIPQPMPAKTKPAEMPKPPKGKGGIATPKGVVPGAKHVPSGRARYNRNDDYDYGYGTYVDNLTSPLGDADFDGTPNIVDNTPYSGSSDSYCAPDTSSSSSWTSDSGSSGCYDSGSSSSSSYDSGSSSSSYDSGSSSSSYDSGSSSSDSSW